MPIDNPKSDREVHKTYRQACHDYAIGFSCPAFWAAVLFGFGILWQQHLPDWLSHALVVFFVGYSVIGFATVVIAYTAPVRFYELLEGEPT